VSSNPRVEFELFSSRATVPEPVPGKRIIVHLVVNVEHWRYDHPMPRKLLPAPHGNEAVPDVPNYSWAEYGMRCGMPRLFETFARRGLPASCSLNAGVIDAYPALADAILAAGWEIIGHGMHQKSMQSEDSEAAVVQQAIDRITEWTGKPVNGWLSPGLRQGNETLDVLKAAGVKYCCDWILDDLPVWMKTVHGPILSVPYSLEINDSVIYAVEKHSSSEMYDRLVSTLAVLDAETDRGARIITLGLHPHLIAVPHRFHHFERMLDLLTARQDTVFMVGSDIHDWYESAVPAPAV